MTVLEMLKALGPGPGHQDYRLTPWFMDFLVRMDSQDKARVEPSKQCGCGLYGCPICSQPAKSVAQYSTPVHNAVYQAGQLAAMDYVLRHIGHDVGCKVLKQEVEAYREKLCPRFDR
jgi:hypothetical protein